MILTLEGVAAVAYSGGFAFAENGWSSAVGAAAISAARKVRMERNFIVLRNFSRLRLLEAGDAEDAGVISSGSLASFMSQPEEY